MPESFSSSLSLPGYGLWSRLNDKRVPLSFTLEITARCNNDCRHCYINLPAGDLKARQNELTFAEIESFTSQAVELGALWCLVTGGEPLLRPDFMDIYRMLKQKGLLISVFTNACLVTDDHVRLFQQYPPRELEITVYGTTRETYERVSRKPGSFTAFQKGLNRLIRAGVKVNLKAVALQSNIAEMSEIGRFCRKLTASYYRFDPFMHLRLDGNPKRNVEIKSERLSAPEIVEIEQSDAQRIAALIKACGESFSKEYELSNHQAMFSCGAGVNSFTVGYDGSFRLCEALVQPEFTYDLRQGSLSDAWKRFVPQLRSLQIDSGRGDTRCWSCALKNLCLWCPAIAALEFGQMEGFAPYFCEVAQARSEALRKQAAANNS